MFIQKKRVKQNKDTYFYSVMGEKGVEGEKKILKWEETNINAEQSNSWWGENKLNISHASSEVYAFVGKLETKMNERKLKGQIYFFKKE